MKILSFFRRKQRAPQSRPETSGCTHPAKLVFPLHEDQADPKKITGLKCGQCGERLPAAESKTKEA